MSTPAPPETAIKAAAPCPVCHTPEPAPFASVDGTDYWRCHACEATFMDARHHLPREAEHAQYRLHQNDRDDPGYRNFLSKLAGPLLARLKPGSRGLDYGCGPGPALAAMLSEAGHDMALYDPLFAPDRSVLDARYDFVTCTETAEHFHDPWTEFETLATLLKPGGWLGVMTSFQTNDDAFARWHYRLDPTHVVFYREATLRHIAARLGMQIEVPVKDVALMRKRG